MLIVSNAMCWNREKSSPPVTETAGGSGVADDSLSESGDTRRSEPKNEPASPRGVLSLLPSDLPLRRGPSSAALGADDHSGSSCDSNSQSDPHHQPYNMTYYGGPHGITPASQLLQQQRHHHHQQQQQLVLFQRQHHLQPTHQNTTYQPITDDEESSTLQAEMYRSSDRDKYYEQSSPPMQYYTQNVTSAAIKCLDDSDRM